MCIIVAVEYTDRTRRYVVKMYIVSMWCIPRHICIWICFIVGELRCVIRSDDCKVDVMVNVVIGEYRVGSSEM